MEVIDGLDAPPATNASADDPVYSKLLESARIRAYQLETDFLALMLDPNWDEAVNGRSTRLSEQWKNVGCPVGVIPVPESSADRR